MNEKRKAGMPRGTKAPDGSDPHGSFDDLGRTGCMELSQYEDHLIRVTDTLGGTFEGFAEAFSAGYGLRTFGREEESVKIGAHRLFADDIACLEPLGWKRAVRRFSELTNEELYAVMKLRVDVFVVEQQCPYPELDDRDQDALHLWLANDDGIQAYLRVLGPGVESEYAALGRVVTRLRRQGLGSMLLKEGIRAAQDHFGAETLYLEAQLYARGLYEKHGFRQVSDVFMMDGIPHIRMIREACGAEE